MEKVAIRRPASFRLNSDLLATLKKRASASHRSLNSFVESILIDAMRREPNDVTIAAIEEAESDKELETLDLENFGAYVKAL